MSEPTERAQSSESATWTVTAPSAGGHAAVALDRIGEFEIIDKLGEGSFGQVFLARQTSLGREVALKVTRPGSGTADPSAGSRRSSGVSPADAPTRTVTPPRNEGQLLAGLEHDHIVKVFSEFHDAATGARGLCLQYVPGADLGSVVRRVHADGVPASGAEILAAIDAASRGAVEFDPAALRDRDALATDDFPQAICRLGARLAEALAFAHARGVLHCDIKPANILITPYGRPLLADFNVAFDQDRHRSACGGVGGTLPYMAPEHRAAVMGVEGGRVDERCDVYSLGVVLHELATGERPRRDTGPDPLDRVPRELAAVIRRCLSQAAPGRYQMAAELAAALEGARQLLAARRALPPAGRIGRWAVGHPFAALSVAAVLPHLAASVVNIGYNAVEVELNAAQTRVFFLLVLGYNLLAYPLCFGTAVYFMLKVRAGLTGLGRADGPAVDALRRRVRRIGWQMAACGAAGWLPGALVFPLVIDLTAGPVGWHTYAHYSVSFALAGLIGVVFGYLAVEFVVFRALLPSLGNPDTMTPGTFWDEVRPLTTPFEACLLLACAVPLVGAVLLVALGDGIMTLGFRVLVTGLIGLGVAGVSIAERLTRALRSLASVWQQYGAAREG